VHFVALLYLTELSEQCCVFVIQCCTCPVICKECSCQNGQENLYGGKNASEVIWR
jgi:hypothetical protein